MSEPMAVRSFIMAVLAACLLMSCGESHKAKSVVEDFLNENLADNSVSSVSFTKLDSTFYVKSGVVSNMRRAVEASGVFKSGIHYADFPAKSSKLLFIGVSYVDAKGSMTKHTFYLTPDLTGVVGFKND